MRNNSNIGRKAQAAGSAFEGWVNMQHEKAKHLGILAHVEKTEAHTKVIGGRLIYTENGVADYIGTLEGAGRSLAVEAKSTNGERFYRSDITKTQQEHLEAVALANGLALLVVEFRQAMGVASMKFAIPWLKIPWEVARSAESIQPLNLTKWAVIALDDTCYLSPYHAGGPRSGAHLDRKRKFARE